MRYFVSTIVTLFFTQAASAQDPPVVGLIPRAQKVKIDGKLDDWTGAFVTPVHIGHPDFDNRGAYFLYLWDDDYLYIGLACLDKKPAHVAPDTQIYNGDAVEFYLDTRRGKQLGAKDFEPGSLHMFYTPFTKTEIAPRWALRDLPPFRNLRLKGVELAAAKADWGWTCEFALPWANFPDFKPKAGEVIGIDCELCSSDGGLRVDRTFVYSSPRAVATPSAFGRVRLVDKLEPDDLKGCGRALLPFAVTKSANYDWLYATAGISPTLLAHIGKIEGKVLDAASKTRKTFSGAPVPYVHDPKLMGTTHGGVYLWKGNWEMFDLAPGSYTLEISALDRDGKALLSRRQAFVHGEQTANSGQNPSPMVEKTRAHPRWKEEQPKGDRYKLEVGTLFLPEKLPRKGAIPLLVHFHGSTWLPEVAVAQESKAAVLTVQLGSGSAVYSQAFANPKRFEKLIKEAEAKAKVQFGTVGLSAWSAGYGSVREILKTPAGYDRVKSVLLLDGLHTGYIGGKPGPLVSQLETENLEVFAKFARDALAGKKQMILTHTEVFPGTFASTTETADWLLQELSLRRRPTLVWGPMHTQQLSEVIQGKFRLIGYAGNSAPDHVDQLHALPDYLRWIEW